MIKEDFYFTLQEIKENNGKNGKPLWLIIDDCVYDVTNYLKHPGGRAPHLEQIGEDRKEEFYSIHSSSAKEKRKQFFIGRVKKEKESNNNNNNNDDNNNNMKEDDIERRTKMNPKNKKFNFRQIIFSKYTRAFIVSFITLGLFYLLNKRFKFFLSKSFSR